MKNSSLLEKTVEITVAKMSSSSISVNEASGKNVADFMQKIYDKLVELNNTEND